MASNRESVHERTPDHSPQRNDGQPDHNHARDDHRSQGEHAIAHSIPNGDDTVYARFKAHFSESRANTDLSVMESIRKIHPDKHITVVSPSSADLMEFAHADRAEAHLIKDGDEFLSQRLYYAPEGRRKGGDGRLAERVSFGLYEYIYEKDEFLVYVLEYDSGEGCTVIRQYILTPKDDVGEDTYSPAADRLIKAAGKYSSDLHQEIYVFDCGCWMKDRKLWRALRTAAWDDVILDPAMKETLIRDVESFFESRDVYDEYGVPWKRGIIFHGTPGCGKTISIKALMASLEKRDIASLYVKSLTSRAGNERSVREIFAKARTMAPCMLVFEDLDSLITDKVRSYFLNEVDGLEDNGGILMVGSTNHLERLDAGISKRPSRFDRKYHFKLPGEQERILYCQYWAAKLAKGKKLDLTDDICHTLSRLTEGFSFAYMKELFVQTLLAIVGGRGEIDDDDDDGYVTVTDVAEDAKVLEDSSKLGQSGDRTESTTDDKSEKKQTGNARNTKKGQSKMPGTYDDHSSEAKTVNETVKPQIQEVEIPSHLKSNPLMKILHKQAKALWREMDNMDDYDIHSRPKLG